jgi:hypothetical protein
MVQCGALSRVWHKVKTTQTAGHRVVVILQEAKTGSRESFQRMGARVLAFFPSGTLAFGHAAGWNDDSGVKSGPNHSWSCDAFDGSHGRQRRRRSDALGGDLVRQWSRQNASVVGAAVDSNA